jgi:hypothetical protein
MAWIKVPPEHHPAVRAALPDDPAALPPEPAKAAKAKAAAKKKPRATRS